MRSGDSFLASMPPGTAFLLARWGTVPSNPDRDGASSLVSKSLSATPHDSLWGESQVSKTLQHQYGFRLLHRPLGILIAFCGNMGHGHQHKLDTVGPCTQAWLLVGRKMGLDIIMDSGSSSDLPHQVVPHHCPISCSALHKQLLFSFSPISLPHTC